MGGLHQFVQEMDAGDVSNDDLFVDQLLDFSHGCCDAEEPPEKMEEFEGKKDEAFSVSEKLPAPLDIVLSSETDLDSLMPPDEGLESLEWLSHFVEDTFSDFSLSGKLPEKAAALPPPPQQEKQSFVSVVQTKARTKRARAGNRVCPILSPSLADSTTTSSSSSSSSPTSYVSQSITSEKLLTKKKKKGPPEDSSVSAAAAGQTRRCSHCGVTKTPQWRAGPLGSKTLCNACGVRYKSGRLLPEYRPACSPTFSSELHSNNHRKVMEMRRRKEMEMEAGGAVPSF